MFRRTMKAILGAATLTAAMAVATPASADSAPAPADTAGGGGNARLYINNGVKSQHSASVGDILFTSYR